MHHHPLTPLSEAEINVARDVILASYPDKVIFFREIYLEEPAKKDLVPYLQLEHSGKLSLTSPRPRRLAKCQYDVVGSERVPEFHEAVVDVERKTQINYTVVGKQHQASLTLYVTYVSWFYFNFYPNVHIFFQHRV
jgi:primary-amine oxidase